MNGLLPGRIQVDGTQGVGAEPLRFSTAQPGTPQLNMGLPARVALIVCLALPAPAALAATGGRDLQHGLHHPTLRAVLAAHGISVAGPNHVRHAFDLPNDPYFESAEPYFGTVRLPQAWDLSHGSNGVVIAVVDTGVTAVGDLSTQLLPGRNVLAGTADARDDSAISHGTRVAGVAAATTNNGIGIAGAAWNTRVLPVKVLDARGAGDDLQVAAGIVWAVDHGAMVVNLSLGGPGQGQTLCDAVGYAGSQGVVVVAAAGNGSADTPNYPAACPGAVSVAATDTNGDFAYFSSYGRWVSLAAPGIDILSTRSDNSFAIASGTSFAAPIVSAVAALVAAQHPDWSPGQVGTQLVATVQDRGVPGVDPYYGHGLLDAYAALGGPVQAAALAPSGDVLEPNDTAADASTVFGPMSATISPEGDVDWYAANVRWPASVTFQIGRPPFNARFGPNFRPVLQLYDEDLNLLLKQDDVSTADITHVAARLPAGRYFLRIANRGGARSSGAYSLTLKTVRAHRISKLLIR
jgi:serine protease